MLDSNLPTEGLKLSLMSHPTRFWTPVPTKGVKLYLILSLVEILEETECVVVGGLGSSERNPQ